MVRLALHWDNTTRQEWLIIKIRATTLIGCAHAASYIATHLVRYMSGLPVPRGLYFVFHDWAEPPLRRWCERHPHEL